MYFKWYRLIFRYQYYMGDDNILISHNLSLHSYRIYTGTITLDRDNYASHVIQARNSILSLILKILL